MQYQIFPVTHYQQNCSILWCETTKKAAVVDPGGDVERLIKQLDAMDIELQKIFLTHGHMDHVGGTKALADHYGVEIEGPHIEDKFWIDALATQAQMMGFAEQPPFAPNRWLKDGDKLHFGECTLSVYHCPGHTPGHVIFHHAESQRAFVGDVLFKGSIGRTDFPKGNLEQLIDSIRNKLWPLGDEVVFIPGHGPESNFGHERLHNSFVADHRFG